MRTPSRHFSPSSVPGASLLSSWVCLRFAGRGGGLPGQCDQGRAGRGAGGAGRPACPAGGHRLCGLHRQNRGRVFGGHPSPRDRLPGRDAVPGRSGGEGGGPAVRGRSSALQGPARPGSGPGRSLPGLAQAGQDHPRARQGHQRVVARARSASSSSIRNRPWWTRPTPG